MGSEELASKMWLDGWVEANQANKGEGEAEGITKGENSMCQGTAPSKRRMLSITCKSFRPSQAQGAEASDRKSEKLTLQGTQMITWDHTRIQMLVPACSVTSFIFDSYNPMDYSPTRLLSPWDSPGKNTGEGCHFPLQGISQTQGLNMCLVCLLFCRQILYPLSNLRSPQMMVKVHRWHFCAQK